MRVRTSVCQAGLCVIAIGLTPAPAAVDATAVAVVAKAQIKAGRLRLDAKTCVGIGNGFDPEDVLLRELRGYTLAKDASGWSVAKYESRSLAEPVAQVFRSVRFDRDYHTAQR